MVEKTVISESIDPKERVGNTVIFPQNKVLYADQFTGDSPESVFDKKLINPTTIDDVFNEFKPSKTNVLLQSGDDGSVYEDIEFNCISDFDEENIIKNSKTLSACETKIETFASIIRSIERNRQLRQVIGNKEKRKVLSDVLKCFAQDLSNSI